MEKNSYFTWPIRVYYEDTDCAGIVYYANYLKYLERARTEWLRALGAGQQKLMTEEDGFLFVVIEVNIKYHRSSFLEDDLEVRSKVGEHRKATIVFEQEIYRGDEKIVTARVKCACLDVKTHKPKAMPEELLARMTNLDN
ncbi:MAG: tol-pal system-associated acyl-CoA thioesterase [Burkholderiales bacterium]|nr:tol-pal system-associated acyl-CoA thioesterase [Burkholderiales bacterium]